MGRCQGGARIVVSAYSVRIYKSAGDFIKSQIPKHRKQIKKKIETLKGDPRPRGSKLPGGGHDFHRIRSGNCRVIYKVDDDKLVLVVVVLVGRKSISKNTSETCLID